MFSVRIQCTARSSGIVPVTCFLKPVMIRPVPSGFVRKSESPGLRAALRPDAVGVHRADDREPVLRLLVADRVPACEQTAGRAHLRVSCGEDRAEHLDRQLLGNAAIESASSGVPPIAKTSLSAFVAAIAP